jgi:two-component system, NarL family, sensor kinase
MDELNLKITIVGLVGFAVLTLLIIFFIITVLRNQRLKVKLERDQTLKDIQILENERARIAADLHDDLGSLISAIKLNLECINTTNNPENNIIIEKTATYIDSTMQKIRDISNDLMPKILEQNGLIPAVTDFMNILDAKSKAKIKLINEITDESSISKEVKTHIFRIVQELLNNAVKHANASEINLHLSMINKILKININDNGIGFNEHLDFSKMKSDGLRNIIRRTQLVDGKLFLDTGINKGTSFKIEIPQKNEQYR